MVREGDHETTPETTTNPTAPHSSTTSSNKRNLPLDNDHTYNAGYGPSRGATLALDSMLAGRVL